MSLSCSVVAGGGDPGFSADFFFSCLAISSVFVSLVNAMVFPSGAQTGLPAPFGRSVKTNESPPPVGESPVVRAQACLPFRSRAGKAKISRPATSVAWNRGRLLSVDEAIHRPRQAQTKSKCYN